jgi:hypothetical protein
MSDHCVRRCPDETMTLSFSAWARTEALSGPSACHGLDVMFRS